MSKMKIKLTAALCAIALFAGVTAAHAQEKKPSRLYLAGYLGLNVMRDAGFSELTTASSGEFKFSNAASFAGALGFRLTPNIRVEAEYTHRENDLSSVTRNGFATTSQNGSLSGTTYMANFYYDFMKYEFKDLTPYFTFGLGAVNNDISIGANGVLPAASSEEWDVAWQVGGGVKYKMGPDTYMTTGYRYVDMGEVKARGYTFDNNAHEFRVGLEYSLPVLWGK